jgi:hypothetical protein
MWQELSKLSGKTLLTLGRGQPFDIVEITASRVVIRPSKSGVERAIGMRCFETAYDELLASDGVDLVMFRRHNEMNPVYIAAMLAQLPGIQTIRKPNILLKVIRE